MTENSNKQLIHEDRQSQHEIDAILDPNRTIAITRLIEDGQYEPAKMGISVLWELYQRHYPDILTSILQEQELLKSDPEEYRSNTFSPSKIIQQLGADRGSKLLVSIFDAARKKLAEPQT